MADGMSISSSAQTSLSNLRDLTKQISDTQKRLSTGKRVSSPLDGAAAFFTSSALSSRAASLDALSDGLTGAQHVFDAANAGVSAIQGLLRTAQGLANQALGSAATPTKVIGSNSSVLTTTTQIASTTGSATRLKTGDTITVSDGTTTATYTAANNDTVQTFLTAVNGAANLKVTASLDSSGKINLTGTGTNGITIGGSVTGPATLNAVTGLTAGATAFVANSTRQSLAAQFDAIRTQIDQAAQDASYNGVNLLGGGALTLKFNETGTSTLSVAGSQVNSNGLGVASSSNQFQMDTDVQAALTGITAALTSLQNVTSGFAANGDVIKTRQSFMSSLVGTLKSGADDLVASDPNEDGAILLALQARQQLATTALSLASQQNGSALRLFGLA